MKREEQLSFAASGFDRFSRSTKRANFLMEMDRIVPWERLCRLIEPHYPTGEGGRPAIALERMLRIYFLQQWFNLGDPTVEEALYDSRAMEAFARIDLGREPVPDETTICKFRHLLERHGLGPALLEEVNSYLAENGLRIGRGTIVDATIIAAPSSTKNASGKRDPEMHNVHDSHLLPELLHGDETRVWGDAAYRGKTAVIRARAPHAADYTHTHSARRKGLSNRQREIHRSKASVRARVEHPFQVVKRIFGFAKVRYRGIAKNAHRLVVNFALANLYLHRRRLQLSGA